MPALWPNRRHPPNLFRSEGALGLMQFLKTLFWVIVAVLLAAFAVGNWTPVTIQLWSGLVLETFLPLPIFAAFLLGSLPPYILHRATRWALQRRVNQAERRLAETQALLDPKESEPVASGAIPPSAAPIAVPPGVL